MTPSGHFLVVPLVVMKNLKYIPPSGFTFLLEPKNDTIVSELCPKWPSMVQVGSIYSCSSSVVVSALANETCHKRARSAQDRKRS